MTSNPLRPLLAAVLASAALASTAAPLTLADCDSCNGGRYTLSTDGVALPDSDPVHETFRVRLQIDTTGVDAAVPMAVAIESAAIRVAGGSMIARLIDAPGALDNWTWRLRGLSESGCEGNGEGKGKGKGNDIANGFVCADWVGSGVGMPIGGVFDFLFEVTVDNGKLNTEIDGAHVKARFVTSAGTKIGALVSEDLTLNLPPTARMPETLGPAGGLAQAVPEPAGLALGALGLALLGAMRRRRA